MFISLYITSLGGAIVIFLYQAMATFYNLPFLVGGVMMPIRSILIYNLQKKYISVIVDLLFLALLCFWLGKVCFKNKDLI